MSQAFLYLFSSIAKLNMRRNLQSHFALYCQQLVDNKQCEEKESMLKTYVECSAEIREDVMTYLYHLTYNPKIRERLNDIALDHLDRFRKKFFSEN